MSKVILKKLDDVQTTLTAIQVSQGRTEEKLKAIVAIQERHEKEINDPNGKVCQMEKKQEKMAQEMNSIQLKFGAFVAAISLLATILVNVATSFLNNLWGK